jgi:hypothetical protein
MKAEFLRDENNNIWFTYARDIQIRRLQNKSNVVVFDSRAAAEK